MTNRVLHFDIPIDDSARAGAFYNTVFGWQINRWGPLDYWPMTTGAESGPGAEGALAPRADAPEGVIVYIGVEDIDEALVRVAEAGGSVVTGRAPIPTVGWNARFRDSEGNLVGLFQADEAAGMPDDTPEN